MEIHCTYNPSYSSPCLLLFTISVPVPPGFVSHNLEAFLSNAKSQRSFFKWTASKRSHPSAGLIVLKRAICGAAAKKRAHVGGGRLGRVSTKRTNRSRGVGFSPVGELPYTPKQDARSKPIDSYHHHRPHHGHH